MKSEKKTFLKKALAMICAVVVAVTGIPTLGTNSKASGNTNIPAELEGYKRVTPKDFGLNEEMVYTSDGSTTVDTYYNALNASGYSYFNKSYLETEVALPVAGLNTGSIAFLGKNVLRVYITGTALTLHSPNAAKTLDQTKLTTLGISADQYFNLKLAVDISNNASDSSKTDIKVQMWVNNKKVALDISTITVSDSSMGRSLRVTLTKSGSTIKVKSPTDPVAADALKEYTKVTPESFGITEEVTHTYTDAAIDQNYYVQNTTDFNKTYFETDLSLTETDIQSGLGYLNPYLFRFYITGSSLAVYSLQADKLIYQTELNMLEIKAGEYFNLKFATDIADNAESSDNTDVTVQMWINDQYVAPVHSTITVPDAYIGSWLNVTLTQAGTIKMKTKVEEVITPDAAEVLADYTRVTPKTFGIADAVEHTYADTAIDKSYYVQTTMTFEKAYLDANISLTATDIQSGFGYLNPYLFRFYITGNTLAVYSLQAEELLYQAELEPLGISEGEYFNLKFATDIADNADNSDNTDVTVQMWVNDHYVTPIKNKVTVPDTYIGSWLNVTLNQVGTIKIQSPQEEEPETPVEPEEPIDPDLPAELVGYTKITPENFGITEEVVHTYDGTTAIDKKYSGSNSFIGKKVYFETELSLPTAGSTTGYVAYLNEYLFRIYIVGTDLTVYSHAASKTVYQTSLKGLEISAGEYFNLKFATDMKDNASNSANTDVTVQMWVNNTLVTPKNGTVTVSDGHAGGTNLYVGLNVAGTIKIRPVVEQTEEPEEPDLPAELEQYTKITPENFGITEEVIHTYDGTTAIDKKYAGSNSFNGKKVYFEAEISLPVAGAESGYIAYLNEYLFRIYIVGSDLTVYSHAADKVVYQTSLKSLEIAAGEYFNLKFATDMKDNASDNANTDITVQMWVNNTPVTPKNGTVTVSDGHANGTNLYVGLNTTGTIKIKPVVKVPDEPVEPEQPEEPVDPNLPAELKDYTKVTPENFGITKEVVHTYGTSNKGTYSGSKSFNSMKSYFEADVALTKAAMETGYIAYLNEYLLRIYMTDSTLAVYSPAGKTELYNVSRGTLGIKPGEYFNLKLATDMTDNASDSGNTDIAVQMWVNNTLVTPKDNTITVSDAHANGKNLYISLSTAGTIRLKPHIEVTEGEGQRLGDITYELASGAGYLLTGEGTIIVDGVDTPVGTTLTKPGDYVIQRVISTDKIYIQNLSLYKIGDVNLGGGEEWTKDDQSDLESILNNSTTSNAKKKAADINNDGKVTSKDLVLMKKVIAGDLEQDKVVAQYHVPAMTYDFLGGDSVMPIGGYYGPCSDATITDAMYKTIAESGVNLIVKSYIDYSDTSKQALIKKSLELAEKYGIGMFVSDERLNSLTKDGYIVTEHSYVSDQTELAKLLGDYSTYQSFLGNMIVDEPISDTGFGTIHADRYNRFKYYRGITTALNAYDNLTGYVNLLGSYHLRNRGITYEAYLREIGKATKLLSFDSYPFYEKQYVSGGLSYYLESLGTISKVAREDGYPFWSYVQAGTDYRDDGATGATTGYLTQAQTLWNVNTSLAFGAKGVVYFPLVQPTYFANVDTDLFDYNRNGIIGADNNTNIYYEMVQKANKQISAVDEVLMKAANQGVIAIGKAATDTANVESMIANTDKLISVSGDDALVGCFTYQDTEAFYVVGYDYEATQTQTITLNFDGYHQYRLVQDANVSYCDGNKCVITVAAGEGVLVVVEEVDADANGDGVVSVADIVRYKKVQAKMEDIAYREEYEPDLNKDGSDDKDDIEWLRHYMLKHDKE